jgi:hypothetical protein
MDRPSGLLPGDVDTVKPVSRSGIGRYVTIGPDSKDMTVPNWKFWDKPSSEPNVPAESDDGELRFGLKRRTDLPGSGSTVDPGRAAERDKLLRRREAVMFDVEQAELALEPENPWMERVALLDQAIDQTQAELERTSSLIEPPGAPFPPLPIQNISVSLVEPVSVSFSVGSAPFHYEEEQDWAERGSQLARGELQLVEGDPASILTEEAPSPARDRRVQFLTSALFVFASDLRDRALNGEPIPEGPTLADLATPDPEHGGWRDWKGHSPARAQKQSLLHELRAEEERLLANRAQELDDLAKWADRLPIARRRLAEVDAEIAALGG